MPSKEVGQILAKFSVTIPVDSERYMMRGVYCPYCNEYLGAYSTYYYPEGFPFKCICKESAKLDGVY
jgi:hypothetical protein